MKNSQDETYKMADKKRATCWKNWEEWANVYKMLYSFDDRASQYNGLKLVDVWKSRTAAKLPIAVECTACLVAADLGLGTCSQKTRRLSIAMGLVRFVNGMVDQVQKGLYARSVQSIAVEIGIPDWLVDVRHEATHAALPSIDILEAGLGVALQWLKEKYWDKTLDYISENEQGLDKEIGFLLHEYISIQLSDSKAKEKKLLTSSCLATLTKSLTSRDKIRKIFLPSLVKDGVLFPTPNQLDSLNDEKSRNNASSCIKLWLPLITTVQEKFSSFISDLIINIVGFLIDGEVDELVRFYANKLILKLLNVFPSDKKDEVLRNTLLRYCFMNPSEETRNILENIRYNISVDKKSWKQVIDVFNLAFPFKDIISCSQNEKLSIVSINDEETKNYFDEHPMSGVDMKELEKVIKDKAKEIKDLEPWAPIYGIDWTKIPAGSFLKDFTCPKGEEIDIFAPFLLSNIDEIHENAVGNALLTNNHLIVESGLSHVTYQNNNSEDNKIEASNNEISNDRDETERFLYTNEEIQLLKDRIVIF